MKLFKTSNLNVIKDYIVSWKTLLLLSVTLFFVDFNLSMPLYLYTLDMPDLATSIAAVIAFVISLLPKVTAKLLAKKEYLLAMVAILFGIGLMGFIYIGQYQVTIDAMNNPDPLALLLDADHTVSEATSNRHIIATALTCLLYAIATFTSYLYYSEQYKENPKTSQQFKWADILRTLESQFAFVQSRFQRAFDKPTHIAEAVVRKQMEACQKIIDEKEKKLSNQEIIHKYRLDRLTNTEKQVKTVIELTYRKKSFFNHLKSKLWN